MRVRLAAVLLRMALALIGSCLFARTASAAPAPFCDDRAATLLASAPALQPPEALLRAAAAAPLSFCDDEGSATTPAVAPGHGQHQPTSPQADPALLTCAAPTAAPPAGPLSWPTHTVALAESTHYRIERPPRG